MKPDGKAPPGPLRDRDILRSRNARPLKASQGPSSPSAAAVEAALSSCLDAPEASTSEAGASTSSASGEEERGTEMRMYLDKLRELVPYVPRTGRVSRVQLIHSAIDYITDLQESLEARARRKLRDKQDQSSRPPLAALPQAQLGGGSNTPVSPLMENSANRPPTLLETNTRHPAALAALAAAEEANGSDSFGSSSNSSSLSRTPVTPSAPGPPSPPDPV